MEKLKEYLTVDGWKKDLERTLNRFGVQRDIKHVKEILQKYELTPNEVFGKKIATEYENPYLSDRREKWFLNFRHDVSSGVLRISGIYCQVAVAGTQDEDTSIWSHIPTAEKYKFTFSRNLR